MEDPLSPLTAPPPRYLVESDSSDEEGQGQYPGSSSRRTKPVETHHLVLNVSVSEEYDNALIGVGQAGKYLARLHGESESGLCLECSGKVIGRGRIAGRDLLVGVEEVDAGLSWEVARKMISGIKPRRW
jgi:hypothetical protein